MARELAEIAARVQTGAEPAESVRSLLRHFGFERRGYHKVRIVRRALDSAKLITDPDFNTVGLDDGVIYRAKPRSKPSPTQMPDPNPVVVEVHDSSDVVRGEISSTDPTYRI